MTIKCNSENEFYDAIKGMVERGLTFEANATDWTIKLLGGY